MNREDFHLLDLSKETYPFTKILDLRFEQRKIMYKINQFIEQRDDSIAFGLIEIDDYKEKDFVIE